MKTRTPSATPRNPGATPTSAMKSTSATPSSALKDPNRTRFRTPRRTHRRSVSFSDGKRDGPIRGLSSVEPSARSKRIAEMLARSDSSELDSDSPTKGSGPRTSGSGSSILSTAPSASASANASASSSRQRVFTRSHASRSVGGANATFLTECSPSSRIGRPLNTVDLSNRRLESAARLKEFLPALDALNLNANQLSWLSGIPGGVRTLSVASNRLTGLTSYSHLLNLENLDISRNEVDSLRQLACLRHLRELRADGNTIASVEGLERMDGLVKLSLQGNQLRQLDLSAFRWTRLEMLNVSANRLEKVSGLAGLQALVALNVDDNLLPSLDAGGAMPRLRILRASGNRLRVLHVHWGTPCWPLRLRGSGATKTMGRAAGRESKNVGALGKLENLSLRNQATGRGAQGLRLDFEDVRDAKRLYLSGNALPANFLSAACYNLVYLELANCRLATLPPGLSKLTPNLRALNLNYNFLEDVRGLEGLARLRKLSVVGARLKGTKEIIRAVRGLPEVEGEEQLSAGRWAELDGRFRRGLPDAVYVGRLAYRGLVMRACAGAGAPPLQHPILMLDAPHIQSGDQLNSYNVAQLQYALGADKDISFLNTLSPDPDATLIVPDVDYNSRRMSSSAASADTESSSLSRGEKRAITPNDSPQPKKIRAVDQNTWEIDSSESGNPSEDKDPLDPTKVSLPSIFTTFEDSYRPERRASLPNLSERSSVRHAPYPPSHLRQNYAPSSLSSYTFPPTNEEEKARPTLSTDLRFDNYDSPGAYPPTYSPHSSDYARSAHLSPYPESDHWTTSPSGIVRPSSTPGQLSSPAVKYEDGLRHSSFSAAPPHMSHQMFAGSARISGHHAADRRSLSAGIKSEWAFPASEFPLPSGAAGVQQYPMPPAPALNSPNRSPQAPSSTLVDRPQRKRGKLPKETTDFLKAWLHRHSDHPYPSEEEKKQLCHATGLSMSQVSNWMINVSAHLSLSSFISSVFPLLFFSLASRIIFPPPSSPPSSICLIYHLAIRLSIHSVCRWSFYSSHSILLCFVSITDTHNFLFRPAVVFLPPRIARPRVPQRPHRIRPKAAGARPLVVSLMHGVRPSPGADSLQLYHPMTLQSLPHHPSHHPHHAYHPAHHPDMGYGRSMRMGPGMGLDFSQHPSHAPRGGMYGGPGTGGAYGVPLSAPASMSNANPFSPPTGYLPSPREEGGPRGGQYFDGPPHSGGGGPGGGGNGNGGNGNGNGTESAPGSGYGTPQ
ncbi:Sin component scaffold protein cdc11 [Mycena venus]|uniref:Sin component scaffold protein cdc11 n=1 Tax=Mycena venus TaxID=2733690 RepID=A0A8H7DAC2_9AGAR|nr:Sin component scaffold protein cdc11 [Mycena venus]